MQNIQRPSILKYKCIYKNLYINFRTLRPCGLPQRMFITYMKNKQHDVAKEIKEFMTLISRNLFLKSQCRSNFVLRPNGSKVLSFFIQSDSLVSL